MPGETNSTMGFLDLQFGAMDIISDGTTFDGSSESNKYNATGNVVVGNAGTGSGVVVGLGNTATGKCSRCFANSPFLNFFLQSINKRLNFRISCSNVSRSLYEHVSTATAECRLYGGSQWRTEEWSTTKQY